MGRIAAGRPSSARQAAGRAGIVALRPGCAYRCWRATLPSPRPRWRLRERRSEILPGSRRADHRPPGSRTTSGRAPECLRILAFRRDDSGRKRWVKVASSCNMLTDKLGRLLGAHRQSTSQFAMPIPFRHSRHRARRSRRRWAQSSISARRIFVRGGSCSARTAVPRVAPRRRSDDRSRGMSRGKSRLNDDRTTGSSHEE